MLADFLYVPLTKVHLIRGVPSKTFFLIFFFGFGMVVIIRAYLFIFVVFAFFKLAQILTKKIDVHFFSILHQQFKYSDYV